jgi:hypothetical protein
MIEGEIMSKEANDRVPVVRRVVCAACQVGDLILCGPRHWDSTMRKQAKAIQGHDGWESGWNKAEQGFVDQFGVFMTRKEAMQVAKAAGQVIDIDRGCGGDERALYSEGLY